MWILPIITILVYLIFSQSNDGISEELTELKNYKYTQDIITRETTLRSNLDNKLREKDIKVENKNSLVNASPVSRDFSHDS